MLVGVRPTGTGLLWADSGNLTPARPAKLDKYQPAAALKKSPPQTLANIKALKTMHRYQPMQKKLSETLKRLRRSLVVR